MNANPWRRVTLKSLELAAMWLDVNGVEIPRQLRYDIAALKFSPGMGLDEIQAEYNTRLYSAMDDYTQSEQPITKFRNEFRRTISDGTNMTALTGWVDSGGNGPVPDDLQSWVNSEIESEIAHADDLFTALKELRKTATADEIASNIQQRADGYTNALVGVYAYAKTFANPEQMGLWQYGDTDHCETCRELNGKIEPLSWYRENGYIPQQRGSTTLDCGGWRCQCVIIDPENGDQLMP